MRRPATGRRDLHHQPRAGRRGRRREPPAVVLGDRRRDRESVPAAAAARAGRGGERGDPRRQPGTVVGDLDPDLPADRAHADADDPSPVLGGVADEVRARLGDPQRVGEDRRRRERAVIGVRRRRSSPARRGAGPGGELALVARDEQRRLHAQLRAVGRRQRAPRGRVGLTSSARSTSSRDVRREPRRAPRRGRPAPGRRAPARARSRRRRAGSPPSPCSPSWTANSGPRSSWHARATSTSRRRARRCSATNAAVTSQLQAHDDHADRLLSAGPSTSR